MLEDMLSDRQKLILKAIIEEYVDTGEPVGSKALTDKPYLNFSSATLRNDMAYLEEIGLLEKTHTSSGRVPSDLGYRYYVEHLVTRDTKVADQFPLIDQIFNESKTKEETINKAINLLSNLTNTMTVASENQIDNTAIAKLDLIQISEFEALLVVVTTQAKVESKRVRIPEMGFEEFKKVFETLNKALRGQRVCDVKYILRSDDVVDMISQYMDYQDQIISTFEEAFKEFSKTKTYRSDFEQIFEIPEFRDVDRIHDLVTMVNEENINSLIPDSSNGLSVRIGGDNRVEKMNNCTVISVPYHVDGEEAGTIAVIGPTRMEYRKVIPLLEYIAKNMSKLF